MAIIYKCNLDCLQSRIYSEAIMDDLLLFTPTKKSHIAKSEDLLKAFNVRQYALYGMSRGSSTVCIYLSAAIHNCSSSGSLFFATCKQNN